MENNRRVRDKEKQREYAQRHYEKNKEAMKARAKSFDNEVAIPRIKKLILEHLKDNPCVDCPETDPVVLEFDHRSGEEKLFCIGEATSRKIGVKKLMAEIAKCDVRCANCHRRKTYRERGFTNKDSV